MTRPELSAEDTAGILDQIYRAAKGVPQRFYLTPERLKNFTGRKRLRNEFLEEAGYLLDLYSILMSYPRSAHRRLGFVSWDFAETWEAASQDSLRRASAQPLRVDWLTSARDKLRVIS